MSVAFLPRRGTYYDWINKNPRLRQAEIGYEIGTGRYKIGDGLRCWVDLPYFVDEETTLGYIVEHIDELKGGVTGITETELTDHIESETPHPVYDDGPDLVLLYTNAKV